MIKINDLDICDIDGVIIDKITIDDEYIELNRGSQAVHDSIVFYRNKLRSWTANTKTRGLVRGGGIKPYRQKGTGRARVGSTRSPIRVGGGVIFGPNSFQKPSKKKINKKVLRLALKRSFSEKLVNFSIKVIEKFKYDEYKTKNILETLNKFNILNNKILFIIDNYFNNELFINAVNNISKIKLRTSNSVNSYDFINCNYVIFSKDAISNFLKRLN